MNPVRAGAAVATGAHRRERRRRPHHPRPRTEAAHLLHGGLPHLELATQIAAQASAGGEPFAVVFAGMGLPHADAASVRDVLEGRSAAGDLVLLLNTADDPVVERILTPGSRSRSPSTSRSTSAATCSSC